MRPTSRSIPRLLLVLAAVSTHTACDPNSYFCPGVSLHLPAGQCQVISNVCRDDRRWHVGDRVFFNDKETGRFEFRTEETPIDADFFEQRLCAGDHNPMTSEIVDFTLSHSSADSALVGQSIYRVDTRPELRVTLTATPAAVSPGQPTTLTLDVSGGVPPYVLQWVPEGTASETQTQAVATPLATTTYDVFVRDAMNQAERASTTVTVHAGPPTP